MTPGEARACAATLLGLAAALRPAREPGDAPRGRESVTFDHSARRIDAADIAAVESLAGIAARHGLAELEVVAHAAGLSVRMTRERRAPAARAVSGSAIPAAPLAADRDVAGNALAAGDVEAPEATPGGAVALAPELAELRDSRERPARGGWRSSKSGRSCEPAIRIALVQATGVYNEILATRGGEVTHVFVADETPVERGDALIAVKETIAR